MVNNPMMRVDREFKAWVESEAKKNNTSGREITRQLAELAKLSRAITQREKDKTSYFDF